ncbi:MAG: hypothetical protein GF350_05460, partial [Chitinivibrionales bacterium]|nr:hypothetical protein [Chitinivibrionales bacterium]
MFGVHKALSIADCAKKSAQKAFFAAFILASTGALFGQMSDWGENTDPFFPTKQPEVWSAESLWIGAAFLRDTSKPLEVWLHYGTGCKGELKLVVPLSDSTDTMIFLFHNIDNGGAPTRIDLTDNPLVEQYINHMDTVYFMYRNIAGSCNSRNPRYTGPNRAPGDMCTQGDSSGPCQAVDRYYSPDYSDYLVETTDGREVPIRRRWCISGWIRDSELDVRTDTVEFGFDDRVPWEGPWDGDFNDIIFHMTGIFLIKPSYATILTLTVSDTAIQAGTFATINGEIRDQNDSIRTDLADSIEWFLDPATEMPGDSLTNSIGATTQFTARTAYRTARVIGRYIEEGTGKELRDTARIYILPGDPDHLLIQDAAGAADLYFDESVGGGQLSLGSTETFTENVYAVLRDANGNYVQRSTQTLWDTIAGPDLVVWAGAGTDPSQGQGRIEKTFTQDSGGTYAYANCRIPGYTGPSFRDTILVSIDPTTYDSLRIVNAPGSMITQLSTSIDDSTLLFVEGRRTDNGEWASVSGAWSMDPDLRPRIPASSGPSWNFSPQDTGSATIRVDRQSLFAEITVDVGPGAPDRLALYDTLGMPDVGGVDPLPKYTTARAGDTVDIVAKLFDMQNNWLSSYESLPSQGSQVRWESDKISGGTLTATQGVATKYLPITAGRTDTIVAWLQKDAATRLADTLIVRVNAGPAERIEMVYDTVNLGRVPVDIEFAQNDSVLTVFTVLRDAYDNFAGFAANALWASRDTQHVTAQRGPHTDYGEGIIRRASDDESYVWVVDSFYYIETARWLYDSVNVHLTNISYDSLQIYIFDNGYVRADSLQLRTGQSDILFAYGKHPVRGWEQVPAEWSKSAALVTGSTPPGWSNQWDVAAGEVGTGWIKITREGSVPDSIPVTFLPGDPDRLDIYDQPGDPAGVPPLTAATVTAGHTLDL